MASPARSQFTDVVGYKDPSNNFQLATTTRVTVYVAVPYAVSPQTTLAQIYSVEAGAGTPGNPFNATTGDVNFWAAPGSYDIMIEDTGSPAKFATRVVRWDAMPGDKGIIAAMVGDDQVVASAIATGAVGASEIADGSVGTAELGANAVTAPKVEAQQAWQSLSLTKFTTAMRYFKDSLGLVHVQGDSLTTNATLNGGDVLGTLPAGYRPGSTIYRVGLTGTGGGGSVAVISISAAGVMTFLVGTFLAGTYAFSIPPWRAEN